MTLKIIGTYRNISRGTIRDIINDKERSQCLGAGSGRHGRWDAAICSQVDTGGDTEPVNRYSSGCSPLLSVQSMQEILDLSHQLTMVVLETDDTLASQTHLVDVNVTAWIRILVQQITMHSNVSILQIETFYGGKNLTIYIESLPEPELHRKC